MPSRRAPIRTAVTAVFAGASLTLAVLLASSAAAVALSRPAGLTPYVVVSGSMEPALPTGSIAVVKSVDPDEISAGDVITYVPPESIARPGGARTITHRVRSVVPGAAGRRRFVTQGDANTQPDPWYVNARQVVGKVVLTLPYAGRPDLALRSPPPALYALLVTLAAIGPCAWYTSLRTDGRWTSCTRDPS